VPKPSGAVGGLQVVNWAGFKAAVSYNFDDSNSSQLSNYAALKALGVKFTFYMWGQKITQGPQSTWASVANDGHEFGNHTWDHNDANMSQSDVDQCSQAIKNDFGITTYTFAAPNGTAGWSQYAQTHHFMDRGVADGLMMPGNETSPTPWALHCYIPPTGAPTSDFDAEIDGARSGGGWRVILVHGFTGGNDGAYQPVGISQYTAGITYAKSFPDLWIDTMLAVGAYWRGQNAFNKATKTTVGTSTTYKWTLPPNFPPNRYLRVTLTGGNITQNGTTLPWSTHGYNEISLDNGSLTVGP
jgi:peptidoglycan/xylan/chitin deacetylase (PgdA/CDA1 family)